jgi:hypothetical protein
MFPYLTLMTARVLQEERIREAEQYRRATTFREPHRWRQRVGTSLIHLGNALAEEPTDRPAPTRASMA